MLNTYQVKFAIFVGGYSVDDKQLEQVAMDVGGKNIYKIRWKDTFQIASLLYQTHM